MSKPYSPLPWSYSALTSFETCPRKHYHLKVAKDVVEPQGEAAMWGDTVHKAIEARIKNKTLLPKGMEKWERVASKFDTPKGLLFTEERFALTKNMQPCKWGATDCWTRGIIDIGVDAGEKVFLGDWKTGTVKHDLDQLKLFAGLYMQTKLYVKKVKTAFIWLAHNKVTKEEFTRDDLPEIWGDFAARARRLEVAAQQNKWPPKPSGLCKAWCHVMTCEFNGRR